MGKNLLVQIITIILSLFATVLGLLIEESDLIFIGLFDTVLMTILIHQSFKKQPLKLIWIVFLPILLVVCIVSNYIVSESYFEDDLYKWIVDIVGTVPVYTASAFTIIGIQIGYCDVRLDKVMMGIYTLFTSLAMGALIGAGYYVYNVGRNISEELANSANYWLGVEYLAVTIASILSMIVVWKIMDAREIKLFSTEIVLEASE